ncbi:MAG: hypothetical protein ACE5EC_00565 [Phycisphaerae bacterium]
MTSKQSADRWRGLLGGIPPGARVMLTAFLLIIGAGYCVAVANIYHSHQMADGKEGMTIDDVRAVYGGLRVAEGEAVPSRMLTMITGAMRQYIDSDEDFTILEDWLKEGGMEAGLDQGTGSKTPRRILILTCLRCHAQSTETEISQKSPFGPDDFDVDYAMLSSFASAGPAPTGEPIEAPPQYTIPRLVLVSHVHMLAIPVFTLIVALLFSMTRFPARPRAWLTPLPMMALILDFAGWWLARMAGSFVFVLLGAGAIFGLIFGFQILVVFIDLWRPASRGAPVVPD